MDGGGGSATPVNATRSLINVSSNGTLILNEKSVLQNNKCPEKFSTNGAAVYSSQGIIKICGGTVKYNSNAYSGNYGGGIYLTKGTFIMTSGNFEANSSYEQGGALYIENSNVSISGGQFISNSLTGSEIPQDGYYGSAVYFSSITTKEAISNLTVKNNQNAGYGTLYITGSGNDTESISICYCTFEDNSAYQRGGAICTAGTSYVDITSSSFINNKVMSDTAHGGAIYVANTYGSLKVNDCNFDNNTNNNTNTLDTIYYHSASDVVVTVDETQLSANVVWNPS